MSVNSWPTYMQYPHWWWLSDEKTTSDGQRAVANTFNMDDDLTTARGNNPYTGEVAYNPEPDLEEAEVAFQEYRQKVLLLEPTDNFNDDFDAAKANLEEVSGLVVPLDPDIESDIDEAVAAYENKLTPELMRSIGRFAAGRQEASATLGTGFTFGLVELERAHLDKVANFRAEIHTKFRQDAFQFKLERDGKKMQLGYAWLAGVMEMLSKMRIAQVTAYSDTSKQGNEVAKMGLVARKEQKDMTLALGVKNTLYNLDLYAYGGNLLAAVSGGVYRTASENSKIEKWVSGIAAIGGAIGGYSGFKDILSDIKGWGDDDSWWS